jgi:CSLREA domain-containing protein
MRIRGIGALLGLLLALLPTTPARAATITVTTTADEHTNPGPETGCSLREAVTASNTDAAFGGCPAGSGTDTIQLASGPYVLSRTNSPFPEDANVTGDLDLLTDDVVIQVPPAVRPPSMRTTSTGSST